MIKNVKTIILGLGAVAMIYAFTPFQANQNVVKGWVVNAKEDTLRGDIKINPKRELDQYLKVAIKVGTTNSNFNASKAKAYGFEDKVFVSRQIEGEYLFLRQLSEGKVRLLEAKTEKYVMNNTKIYTDYYFEKTIGPEPTHIKSGKGFKKQMAELMADNADIVKALEEKKYEYEKIVELFDEYNGVGAAASE